MKPSCPVVETNTRVYKDFARAWAAGDFEQTLHHIAPDAVYTLYISEEQLPFAGETVGRDAIEGALRAIRQQFEYLLYRPQNIVADGDIVRSQVEFMYRHRASGEILSGRFRIIFKIIDEKIVRADEYHDRARIEAFMRLIASGL